MPHRTVFPYRILPTVLVLFCWLSNGATARAQPPAEPPDEPLAGVPGFLGDFFAPRFAGYRNLSGGGPTRTLQFEVSGLGLLAAPGAGPIVFPAVPFAGPDGFASTALVVQSQNAPVVLTGVGQTFALLESAALTAQIQAAFPGAVFDNAFARLVGAVPAIPPARTATAGGDTFELFYIYLQSLGLAGPGQQVGIYLPNPSGGGMVGRNRYFEDGSPMPRTRVYFDYSHVSDYQLPLAPGFNINRCLFGYEQAFLDGLFSLDVRLPFAGTLNNQQSATGGLSVDQIEFGNVGLALKGVVFRTPEFLLSLGLGLSLPTASDSRLSLPGVGTLIEVRNETILLQPLLGLMWAPTERFFAQVAMQLDIDPNGNGVYLRSNQGLTRVGELNDRGYLYLHGNLGYWLYQGPTDALLTGIAAMGELHYTRSLGSANVVGSGDLVVGDLAPDANILNATFGLVFNLGRRTQLRLGLTLPVNDKLMDWTAQVQLNVALGP